jgi:hypothetical protein
MSRGRSIGPAPKSEKITGEFRNPEERPHGQPFLRGWYRSIEDTENDFGRRLYDRNDRPAGRPYGTASLADGGSVIDRLRADLEAPSNPDPETAARNHQTARDMALDVTPIIGNVRSGMDAVESGGKAWDALQAGEYGTAAGEAGLSALGAFGAVAGLPFGKMARNAAETGRDTLRVFAPTGPGRNADRAMDMRRGGADSREVHRNTGLLFEPGGRLLDEIPDNRMNIRSDLQPGNAPLGSVIDHPELMARYPEFADIPVSLRNAITDNGPVYRTGSDGTFDASLEGTPEEMRAGIAKLLQYRIADKEGMPAALRHGRTALPDTVRATLDRIKGISGVDDYAASLRRPADDYMVGYAKNNQKRGWESKFGMRSAGNLTAKAAENRANQPDDVLRETWPYAASAPYHTTGQRKRSPSFDNTYSLPPQGASDDEIRAFVDRWRDTGAGRRGFAAGGRVGKALRRAAVTLGAVEGPTGGREDALEVQVPAGAYVVPADVVSALGEGNTAAGMVKLTDRFGTAPKGGYANGGAVPILISDGEFVVSPEAVAELGGGDLEYGHTVLDEFVLGTRQAYTEHLQSLPEPNA